MTYIEEKALYYSMFSAALLNQDLSEVYKDISSIFIGGTAHARELLLNDTVNNLDTTAALNTAIRYTTSFCSNVSAIVTDPDMIEVMRMKADIIRFEAAFNQNMQGNMLANLSAKHENISYTVGYALSLYVRNKNAIKDCISILKDAVNGSEGIDACVALMSLDKQHTQEWFNILNADPNAGFYPDLIESLAQYYGLNINKPQAKSFAFWQRRNDSV